MVETSRSLDQAPFLDRSDSVESAPPGWRVRLHIVVEAPTLGRLVLQRGLVTHQQLAHAIAIQRLSGERLGHVLARLEYVDEADLQRLLNRQRLLRWLSYLLG